MMWIVGFLLAWFVFGLVAAVEHALLGRDALGAFFLRVLGGPISWFIG